MLIVSNFNDYYDSATSTGVDKTIVYDRKEASIDNLPEVRSIFTSKSKFGYDHKDFNNCVCIVTGKQIGRAHV